MQMCETVGVLCSCHPPDSRSQLWQDAELSGRSQEGVWVPGPETSGQHRREAEARCDERTRHFSPRPLCLSHEPREPGPAGEEEPAARRRQRLDLGTAAGDVSSCFRTFLWSSSRVRWRRWWGHREKVKAPVWVSSSASMSRSMGKSDWTANHWTPTSTTSSTRRSSMQHLNVYF